MLPGDSGSGIVSSCASATAGASLVPPVPTQSMLVSLKLGVPTNELHLSKFKVMIAVFWLQLGLFV
jgi:hypothetical protein